ncbi:MAG TPA: hypothetical protein VHW44_17580 [Pseudonocardiaceae bacterium]|jgi:hypothetical protein|nr:hypothetical protein [Pseudonocardiaceae bacterium]
MWIRRMVAVVVAVGALVLVIGAGAASAATAIEYGLLASPGQHAVVDN